jgi:iron complex outermembrane receptor protein
MAAKSYLLSSASMIAAAIVAVPANAQAAAEAQAVASSDSVAPQGDDGAGEEIVVRGIRASLTQSLAIKREAPQIVESVVAEDVGKLPDNNVIEALQRVTGVQITDRTQGEARTISIRGLTDVTTTLNGREIFTASGRQFSLSDIPSNLVRRIDVYKTRAAEQIETGIAGQVDVFTRRPLDFDGFAISGVARGIYNEQRGAFNPNLSGLISNRWETGIGDVGALVNLSYSKNRALDSNISSGAMVPFVAPGTTVATKNGTWNSLDRIFATDPRAPLRTSSPTANPADPGNPFPANPIFQSGLNAGLPQAVGSSFTLENADGTTYKLPYVLGRDAIFQNALLSSRERPAVNVALQWAPNDSSKYTFEFFWNQLNLVTYNDLFFTFVDGKPPAGVTGSAAGAVYDGTNILSSRSIANASGFTSGDYTHEKTNSFVYSLAGEWTITDHLHLNADFNYQKSDFTRLFAGTRANRVAPLLNVSFNGGNGYPAFDFPGGPDLTAPGTWTLGEFYDSGAYNKGSAYTFQGNGDYSFDDGFLRKISFGVRYDDRSASEATRSQTSGAYGGSLSQLPGDALFTQDGFFDGRGNVPQNWVLVNGYYVADHLDDWRKMYNAKFPNLIKLTTPFTTNFNAEEINTAAYVQGDFQLDIFGRPLKIETGVRFVDIKTLLTFGTTNANKHVNKFLPAFTAAYDLTDKLRLRFNYGETLRRPTFSNLNPNYTLNDDLTHVGYGTGTAGNADLSSTTSKNYDLAVEWYFSKDSAIYATAFIRDIQGLVVNLQRSVNFTTLPPQYASYVARTFIVNQPVNASNGTLKGIELGATYFPKFLPSFLDGLGFNGSVTILDSSQEVPQANSAGVIIGTLKNDFFGVSKLSYNATLAYDKGPVGARLSYVWRQGFLNANSSAAFANPIGIYRKAERSLDFQLSYQLAKNAAVTFDATNLTDGLQAQYYAFGDAGGPDIANGGANIIGRTFAVGVRYSFN